MSNILVHKKTGEVIHIDFGVVFEQGMVCIIAIYCLLRMFYLKSFYFSIALNCSGDCTFSAYKKRNRRHGLYWGRRNIYESC